MKHNPFRQKRLVAAIGGIALAAAGTHAFGSAFALQEQSVSGLGNAYAGGAAGAEDVSTIYFNPAGLVRLQSTQAVVGANLICPSVRFHDNGSQPAAFQPLGSSGGDAGGCEAVPNLYAGIPITDKWALGLGVNVPFGLKTEYDSDWIGRFQAVKSKLETININPTVSWAPTNTLSVGAGIDWQRLKASLTNRVNYAAAFAQGVAGGVAAGQIPAAAAPTLIGSAAGLESNANVSGDDSAWGWNAGVLWQATPQTRIGAAYRSKIKYNVTGSVEFSNPTGVGPLPATLAPVGAAIVNGVNSALSNGDISLALKLPDTANVSAFSKLDDRWDVMADVQYTGWSSVPQLQVVRSTGVVLSTTPENFRNTWRGSVGANYHMNDSWTLRGGLAFDQSPIRDAQRTPRLPDNDRTWLALGAQYKFSPNLSVDMGYAYIFVKDPGINQNQGNTAANGLLNGSYSNNVNIVGLQLTYTLK